MPRTYDVKPDAAKGERPLSEGAKVETDDGRPLVRVVRVEFDGDADEGPAVVTCEVPVTDGFHRPNERTATRREATRVAAKLTLPGA